MVLTPDEREEEQRLFADAGERHIALGDATVPDPGAADDGDDSLDGRLECLAPEVDPDKGEDLRKQHDCDSYYGCAHEGHYLTFSSLLDASWG